MEEIIKKKMQTEKLRPSLMRREYKTVKVASTHRVDDALQTPKIQSPLFGHEYEKR